MIDGQHTQMMEAGIKSDSKTNSEKHNWKNNNKIKYWNCYPLRIGTVTTVAGSSVALS